MSNTLDDINDLIEQLEIYNKNTDGNGPGETVSVFVWPDEWMILYGGKRAAEKHLRESGRKGKYAVVRIPGHNKPFDAQAEALRVFRELGIRVLNPPRAHRRSTGGTHTRYIGDAAIHLEHYGQGNFEAEICLVGGEGEIVWASPIKARPTTRDPDNADFIDRLAATAVALAITEGHSAVVRRATESAVDGHGGYEVVRGNPEGPPPGVPWFKSPTKVNPAGACPACGCARHECECPTPVVPVTRSGWYLLSDGTVGYYVGGAHKDGSTGYKLKEVRQRSEIRHLVDHVIGEKNPAGLTAKGERMYEHVKASYAGDPRAKEIAARTVLARAGEGVPGLKKNPLGYDRKTIVRALAGHLLSGDRDSYDKLVRALRDADGPLATATTKIELDARQEAMKLGGHGVGFKKNPNPDYMWFVATARGTIFSGWEFKSDAEEDLRDNASFYDEAKEFLGPVKVVARRTLERLSVDPEDENAWYVGARVGPVGPRENPARDFLEVWTSFGERHIKNRPTPQLVAVRLVREALGWRVDYTEAVAGAWMPWETAVEGPFKTKAAAEKAARAWAADENISLEGFSEKMKKNPSHGDLERAARGGPRTPEIDAWIRLYPKTWAGMTKRSTR